MPSTGTLLSAAFDRADAAADAAPADWVGIDLVSMRAANVDALTYDVAVAVMYELLNAIADARPVVESAEHIAWEARAAVLAPILARSPPEPLATVIAGLNNEEPPVNGDAEVTQTRKVDAIAGANALFGTT